MDTIESPIHPVVESDTGSPDQPADHNGRPGGHKRHHRVRWAVLGVVGVLVVVGVVTWFVHPHAQPVTTEQAASQLPPGQTGLALLGRPAPGVYRYVGTGTDRLSFPPLSQPEGPTMPATVTLLPHDCWRYIVNYSTFHWQNWTYCRTAAGVMESGGQTWQKWMVGALAITNLSDFDCGGHSFAIPAARTVGQVWRSVCVGHNSAMSGTTKTAGPYKFLGEEPLNVSGAKILAAHFLRLRTMTGAQQGTERTDVWFDDRTGLPLRDTRKIVTRSPTPIGGSTTYTETGGFRLVALAPIR